ncbi:MAG: hypothetical protein WCJ74_01005 [bacterium]
MKKIFIGMVFVALMFVCAPTPASAVNIQAGVASQAEQLNLIASVLQSMKTLVQLWKESPLALGAAKVSTVKTTASPIYTLTISTVGPGEVTDFGVIHTTNMLLPCGKGTEFELGAFYDKRIAKFIGWSGACSGTGNCNIIMDSSKTVTAIFASLSTTTTPPTPTPVTPPVVTTPTPSTITPVTFPVVTTPTTPTTITSVTPPVVVTPTTPTPISPTPPTVTPTPVTNPPIIYTYTLSVAKPTEGVITSLTDYGIECPGTSCAKEYPQNTTVILKASNMDPLWGEWGGDCAGETGMYCHLFMDKNRYASVLSSTPAPTTSVIVTKPLTNTGSGTITSLPVGINCGATCQKAYPQLTYVALTALPDAGSTFSWGGECLGTIGNVCTINTGVSLSKKNVIGIFMATPTVPVITTKLLTVSKTGSGMGTITSLPAGINCGTTCSKSYDSGNPVTLTATPYIGSRFVKWSGDVTGSTTVATTSVVMSAYKKVYAEFAVVCPTLLTKLRTKMNSLLNLALKGDFESGELMVCFNDGTVKEYGTTYTQDDYRYVMYYPANVLKDKNKYKGIYSLTTLHNHPLPLIKNLIAKKLISLTLGNGFPPSTADYDVLVKLIHTFGNQIKYYSYALDGESNIWQYDIPTDSVFWEGELAFTRSGGANMYGCFERIGSCARERDTNNGSVSAYLNALRNAGVNVDKVSMP